MLLWIFLGTPKLIFKSEENIFRGQKAIKVAINKPYGAFYLSSYLFLETFFLPKFGFLLRLRSSQFSVASG